ncbi:MAG: MarR family transcriptional regulator [Candidatus Omnitrophica bacterium]|nr:MarR family transcriptional regulator [Candidatus Omnitrophota bacterium]
MFSEPVVGDKFFGRDEVLEILNKRTLALKDGYRQNVALTGQSLAGKSSIILQFLHTIKEDGFIPVYVEVIKEPFGAFAGKFIATMLYHALAKKGEEVSVNIDSLMERASLALPKTHSAIKHINLCIENEEYEQAYSCLLELTSTLKLESGIPCIVILDEFDNLEHLGIRNPFVAFGKVIMVQKDTMYIVSSSRSLAIRKIISEKLSLLFGNFEILKVENFGTRVSNEFISIRLAGFDIDNFIRKFLIAFTDGNPFYLNKMICRMKDIALEQMTSHIDMEITIEAILDLVYNPSGTIHQYLMNYMLELIDAKPKDFHISILASIANGRKRPSEIARHIHMTQAGVTEALQRLSEQGLVARSGIFYAIGDVMFDFWLKNVYERKKRLLVDGAIDKRSLFRGEIKAYIGGFEREFALSTAERLAGLFNLFSNELVSLNMKNSKMPHFTKVEVRSFADSQEFIAASFRGNFWIAQSYERNVNENDIVAFIRNVKGLEHKISSKLIIPLKGIDENARLLAKELKISIWDSRTVNTLLTLYNKKRMIVL